MGRSVPLSSMLLSLAITAGYETAASRQQFNWKLATITTPSQAAGK